MKELGQISDNLRTVKEWEVIGAPCKLLILQLWCERGDSNPHGCPLDPKSSASASSATLAYINFNNLPTVPSQPILRLCMSLCMNLF